MRGASRPCHSSQLARSLVQPSCSNSRTIRPAPPRCTAGILVSVDSYMNLQLASTEEFIDGAFAGNLGEVLIRCNNVLYIRAGQDEGEAAGADSAMKE